MSDHCSIQQQTMHFPMEAPSECVMEQEFDMSGVSRRQRSRRRRNNNICPSRFILLTLCFAASSSWRSHAFSSPPLSTRRSSFSCPSATDFQNNKHDNNNNQQRRFYMSSLAEPPGAQSNSSASSMTDFQRRMKGLVKRNGGGPTSGRRSLGQRASDKPTNIKTVNTLEEYKEVLDENKGKMVVARFFATWCKACKAIQPSYYRMATMYPHITFLEVPVTNQNANLHQGLEVPSLPYGHIYYPEAGLVEELKISKKYFHSLVKMVRWYDSGECALDDFVPPVEESDDEN